MNIRVLALDVDGALIDSCEECYRRCQETWKNVCREDFPLTKKQFREIRPHVKRVEDFFSLTLVMLNNNFQLPSDFKKIMAQYGGNESKSMGAIFYNMRKAAQANDMDAWIAESVLYPGVQKMVNEISDAGIRLFIVSSKDAHSIRAVLDHYGFKDRIEGIFDREVGFRKEQFQKLLELVNNPNEVAVYDDLASQLEVARSMGIIRLRAFLFLLSIYRDKLFMTSSFQ